MKKGTNIVVKDKNTILDILGNKSSAIKKLLENSNDSFSLFYKDITHSDLISCGKRTKVEQSFSKNLLYYLTDREMQVIEENSTKPFETAHQSCIGLRKDFYLTLGIPDPREKEVYKIQDKGVNVYLVNETVKYFSYEYTKKVIDALNKTSYLKWNSSPVPLSDGEFTEIEVSVAVHGLGVKDNIEFQNLRKSIFINDRIYFLIRESDPKELYIIMDKNPKFFEITGLANDSWIRFLSTQRQHEKEKSITDKRVLLSIDDEKTRLMQSKWKELLAAEMKNYTTQEGVVFCPFTGIAANIDDVPMLFIASHIKRYSDSSSEEAFDINNGLLLSANADALFDKHMITVTEDKQLKFSYLIDKDAKLKSDLRLMCPIFDLILNEKRMMYMEEHRRIFEEKEKVRKFGTNKSNNDYIMDVVDDTTSMAANGKGVFQ